MKIIYLISLSLVLLVPVCSEQSKTWRRNRNYNNPDNWSGKHVPCPGDRVIINSDEPISVFIQVNTTLKELVLPKTGELILGDNVIITFSSEELTKLDNTACRGIDPSDSEFINIEDKSWFDPDNWESKSSDGIYKNILPSEQIPCFLDSVVFPPDSSFKVKMDFPVPLTLHSFKYGNIDFNLTGLQAFLNSPSGQIQFRRGSGNTMINLQHPCSYKYGCSCGNDKKEILAKICSASSQQCNSQLPCQTSVTPTGECCGICGGYIWLNYSKSLFDFSNFVTFIQNSLDKMDLSEVSFNTSLLSDDKIQAVIVDEKNGQSASDATYKLASHIKREAIALGVDVTNIIASQKPSFETAPYTGLNSASTAGIVIAVLLCIILIVIAAALVYKKKRIGGFRFAKFFEFEKSSEIDLGVRATFSLPSEPEAAIRAFDNPMYNTPTKDEIDMIENIGAFMSPMEIKHTMNMDLHIINPVYDAMEEMTEDSHI